MSYYSWKNVWNFQKYHSKNNKEFLDNLSKIPRTDYNSDIIELKNRVINEDITESTNQVEELTQLYNQNKLITSRIGCVESAFIIKYLKINLPTHLYKENNIDHHMKSNAGFYYKDSNRKKELWKWWIDETIDLIKSEIITSCYCFLNFDLIMWSSLDLNKKFYNYCIVNKILLKNSEGKKILYIGNSVDSIKTGYDRGVQNAWNFPVSNFSMYYLKTPQTTLGCEYPHDSIKETCEILLNQIEENYKDFDTAILGCGAYGPPLINALRKKFINKNIVYLGGECFKMFGVYSNGMPYTNYNDAIKENWIEVLEERPKGCENHPEPKYWK